ncbi:MAG: hypothetical protein KDK08_05325 [Rhizobiaceae bacterium]|mgnify:CR=1 FL=1|nr:hypothetical protein [Rhizobiaceae bacterium]MCC0000891.1 hypothetical protein [Methylobacteriaceae bacterium]
MARMTFEDWLKLAREYGQVMYVWDDFSDEQAKEHGYDNQLSPREYVDGEAERFNLDSWPELNWGHNPPGFDPTRFQ